MPAFVKGGCVFVVCREQLVGRGVWPVAKVSVVVATKAPYMDKRDTRRVIAVLSVWVMRTPIEVLYAVHDL